MRRTAGHFEALLAVCAAALAAGCDEATHPAPREEQRATNSVAYLKSLCDGRNSVVVTQEITVQGYVAANDRYGEFTKSLVIEDATGGITVAADLESVADVEDGDPTAVRVASENVSHNNLDSVITVRQGDLLAGTEGTADIIVANIVADVILQLLPDVPARLNKGGYFVASGIISERLGEITHGAMTCGLTVDRVVERDGWAVVVSHKEED